MEIRNFPCNTVIRKEGEPGKDFFIMLSGQVQIFKEDDKKKDHILTNLKAGDCFGEMCYLSRKDAARRSATVTTTSDCIVVKVRSEDLVKASENCRRLFDQRFLATLVERLEAANEQLAVMS